MKPDLTHGEGVRLRAYIEAVADLVGVEPAASLSELGRPSTGYIALAARSPRHPGRLLMAQWSSDAGWCLALEPEHCEEPVVLKAWPHPRQPDPQVVARRIREALTADLAPDLPARVPADAGGYPRHEPTHG